MIGTIRSKLDDWRRQLLDLTKRNPLVNTKIGRRSGIEIEYPAPDAVWQQLVLDNSALTFVWNRDLVEDEADEDSAELSLYIEDEETPAAPCAPRATLDRCLASPDLKKHHVLTQLTDRALALRLNRLRLNAKTSLDEQGVNVLFVTFGLLRWYESPDSDVPIFSPLLLVPVELKRASREAPWTVSPYEEEVVPNLCLSEMMRANFGLRFPDIQAEDLDGPGGRESYFDSVRSAISVSPRWELLDRVTLGTFSFQKVAMWQDLGENAERVAGHGLCRGIAGDETAEVAGATNLPSERDFDDRVPPHELHTILDCDSSQLGAVLAVKNGTSLVLDGPPGTGKSQTIANIIAEFLADKKTVLFVSEKAAALEVVKRRLDACNLGDFCLECHSHKANKKVVVADLGRCLALPPEEYRDQSDDLDRLQEHRQQLNRYVRSLHKTHKGLGLTPFEVHGRLAALKPTRDSRCVIPDVLAMDAATLRQIIERLSGLPKCRGVIENFDNYSWQGCRVKRFSLTVQGDICHGFDTLAAAIESFGEPLLALREAGFMPERPGLQQLEAGLARAREVLAYPEIPAEWFAADPRAVANGFLLLHSATVEFRQLLASLSVFRVEGMGSDASAILSRLADYSDPWVRRIQGEAAASIREQRDRVSGLIDRLATMRRQLGAIQLAVDDLVAGLQLSLPPETSLAMLDGLAGAGKTVAKTGPINPKWLDKTRRGALKCIASECQSQLTLAAELRRTLSVRLCPVAFERESEALAGEWEVFRSFWRRLFGAWPDFRRQVRGLYLDGALPPTQKLFDDMQQLRAYHTRMGTVRSAEADNADSLVRDASGAVQWGAIVAGIEATEEVEHLLKNVPECLRPALATDGATDRESMQHAANYLEDLLASFADQLQDVRGTYSIGQIGPGGKMPKDASPEEFVDWISAAEAGLRDYLQLHDAVIALLNDGRDVMANEVTTCVKRLIRLCELRQRIADLARQLQSVIDPMSVAERSDWSVHADKARWLLAFLEGGTPAAILQVITNPEVRERVANAESQASAILTDRFREGWETLVTVFDPEKRVSTGFVISKASLDELREWLLARIADVDRLQEWMSFRETQKALRGLKVEAVLDEVLRREVPLEEARDAFLARFFRLWLDAVYAKDACLRKFDFNEHEALIESFRKLDGDVIAGGHKRIRSCLLQDPGRPHIGMLNAPATSEVGILLKEVSKKRRHLPLRLLFRRIPTLLQRIKPCVMMSPLAVSTYLDAATEFDVVIFDEASQVRPFDAIGAIYRGRQLVVAGDQKQLPPTTFFDRLISDEDEGGTNGEDEESDTGTNLADFESILDVCCSIGMPRERLKWHYRSRREPLIAFSNRHFYGNELVTFPSVQDADNTSAVQFVFVEDGKWKSGAGGGVNLVEACETAKLVLKQIQEHPSQSLGVIAFNRRQQFAILDQLDKFRSLWPELESEPFFDESREEPFFVKNLENVQGDERDRIIISVGYGYDELGKFAMRFGPLNRQGGERRLNVAVTRAKHQVILVSSIHGNDIDLRRTKSDGARLLRAYLECAEGGIKTAELDLADDSQGDGDSDFERQVESELRLRGLNVRRHVGCGRNRIELALVHPDDPKRYVLGIECDGAIYRDSPTARDRDRLRQSVLEGLGWTLCRIWSTDWVRDPKRQVERVLAVYEQAKRHLPAVPLPPHDLEKDQACVQELPVILLRSRVPERAEQTPRYANIEDVPEPVLNATIQDILRRHGQTPQDDLIRAVAQELGFRRTGKRIQAKIRSTIQQLIFDDRLTRSADQKLSAF